MSQEPTTPRTAQEPDTSGGKRQHPTGTEVNACPADNPEKETVIIQAHEFRLAKVFMHLAAGKTVLVIPTQRRPPENN